MESVLGQRRIWPPQKMGVTAVAQIDGWVFAMPDNAGRPFSIAYPAWFELDTAGPKPVRTGAFA